MKIIEIRYNQYYEMKPHGSPIAHWMSYKVTDSNVDKIVKRCGDDDVFRVYLTNGTRVTIFNAFEIIEDLNQNT